MKQWKVTRKAIRVPLESRLYLEDQLHLQRSGHLTGEKTKERIANTYERLYKNEGGYLLMDDDLGGAIGKPENSYEEGRWTSWSVEDMKAMLNEAGLTYTDVEPVECIDIGF